MGAPRILAPTTISGGIPTAGAGTLNTVALWTPDGFTLGNSLLTQAGSVITNATGAIRANGTTQTTPAFMRYDATTSGIYFPATNEIGFTISSQHAMFISSGRLVGIGTTSPASALHVRNNTAGITLDSTLGGGRQYQLNPLRTGLSNSGFEIRDVTAGAAVISFDASQQVGIGTASPNAILSVYNAGTPTISLWNSSNYSRLATNTNDLYIDAGLGGAAGAVIFRRGSGTVDSARIDSSGNVGIGETSPASYGRLAVTGSAVGAGILGMNTDATRVDIQSYNKPLAINRAGNNTLMNEGGGNVGIGTASPIASARLTINETTASATVKQSWTTNNVERAYVSMNGSSGELQIAAGFATYGGLTTFYTNGSERARIDSSGNFILNTATTGATIQAAGSQQGLKLPATPGNADTQTLDCYQDGGASAGGLSWTPTLSAAATWGGTAPTVTNARYTRIGNLVFCTVTLDATGAVAFSSTYGSSTISSPAGLSATASTTVPSNRAGVSANGAQGGTTVYVPTYASNTTVINLTWFFAV